MRVSRQVQGESNTYQRRRQGFWRPVANVTFVAPLARTAELRVQFRQPLPLAPGGNCPSDPRRAATDTY